MKRKLFWCLSSIFCFVAAYFLIGVLSNFFSAGGGVIKVKGLLAPFILFIYGLYSLYKFVNEFGLSKTISIVCVALFMAVGIGTIVYLNSWAYKQKTMVDNIRSGNVSNTEAMKFVQEMIYEHTASAYKAARECVEILINRNSAWAMFQKAQWRKYEGDYDGAFEYMLKAESFLTEDDIIESELYEAIAAAYYDGRGTSIDKNKALDYYILAYTTTLPHSDYDLQRILRIAAELNREITKKDLRYRSKALEPFMAD